MIFVQGTRVDVPYLLIAVGDIPDLVPRKGDFGGQPVFWVIDVKPQSIDPKQQLRALLILQKGKTEQNIPFPFEAGRFLFSSRRI